MKLLLVYPPFCTPASPPYSITNIYGFLKNNCDCEIEVLDLNIKFHNLRFKEYGDYYRKGEFKDYDETTKRYREQTKEVYAISNALVVNDGKPELFDDMLKLVIDSGAYVVAFSVVYSSQVFYTYALAKVLKKKGVKVIVGGPGVSEKLKEIAEFLNNEVELLQYISPETDVENLDCDTLLDFRIWQEEYFIPKLVLPIRTTSSCYYGKCTFCTHHQHAHYLEFPLKNIVKSIELSAERYVFLIDDMISKKRLLEIAESFKGLGVKWMCQLKPAGFDIETLRKLKEAGLEMVIWGVESGSQRVLNMMRKGTVVGEISKVLNDSKKAGIKNVVYIMFGFPTETKSEFLKTIKFLEDNKNAIDLVSTSVFGLQKGTYIYDNLGEFGISEVIEKRRTLLAPKIEYKVEKGLSYEDAVGLRQKYKSTIVRINKYPKNMNFFREHMLL
ncbi:radical SAM protein [Candidatus Woesearchaeota archaeon]|nr:radical SAM protein [Candidatus Woesearchaeota archaeon]